MNSGVSQWNLCIQIELDLYFEPTEKETLKDRIQ